MLGTILTAAVPFVATLAVALYVLRRIHQCGNLVSQSVCEPERNTDEQPDSGYSSGSLREHPPNSTRNRRRPHPYQNRNNNLRQTTGKSESLDMHEREEIDKECAICFEQLTCVRLYPCNHSRICMNCINKIITDGDRLCPFCRRYIEAYTN